MTSLEIYNRIKYQALFAKVHQMYETNYILFLTQQTIYSLQPLMTNGHHVRNSLQTDRLNSSQ